MSRKNYRAFAAVLSVAFTKCGDNPQVGAVLNEITDGLVAVLKADNERFDEQRFRAAVIDRCAEHVDSYR